MASDGPDRTLLISDARLIDMLREDFKRAWEAGSSPRIEEFLSRADASLGPAAFRELLRTEINLRLGSRESVSVDDYLQRFPTYDAAIREACGTRSCTSPPRSGLHVRCPFCHNPIELAPDAELESINCESCGSKFNLTGDEYDATRDARTFAQIGHFKLVERLGMGAFGAVWKAQDIELDRTVAIKIPRAGQLNKQQQDFFLREARSAAQLRHPNIVPVHEVGRDGELLYIVSEFVRGVDLSDWLTGQQPTARHAVELCVQIAGALDHAHQHGVVHRDLKPANIMIDGDGAPHLMDFGLARRDAGELTMTLDGQIIGTPAYMSPEQAKGESHTADQRSDLYSLGVVLYQLLAGELPFRGNARMLMHQVMYEDPPSPRKLNASIPIDLETIALKCMEKKPDKRYQTARELLEDFERFLLHEPILARPVSRAERLTRWAKRKPALAAVAALTIMLAIGGPLTAIRIAQQNQRLKAMVEQRNNLLSGHDKLQASKAREIDRLSSELALRRGQGNPEDVWPQKPPDEDRQKMLSDLFNERLPRIATMLEEGGFEDRRAALGHIGLALLAEELGDADLARGQWMSALQRLQALQAANPKQPIYAIGLADCHVQLARLASENDRGEALRHLDQAAGIYQSIDSEDEAVSRIALVEVESTRARLHAGDATRINNALRQLKKWNRERVDDPVELYRISNYLVGRDPILLLPDRPE